MRTWKPKWSNKKREDGDDLRFRPWPREHGCPSPRQNHGGRRQERHRMRQEAQKGERWKTSWLFGWLVCFCFCFFDWLEFEIVRTRNGLLLECKYRQNDVFAKWSVDPIYSISTGAYRKSRRIQKIDSMTLSFPTVSYIFRSSSRNHNRKFSPRHMFSRQNYMPIEQNFNCWTQTVAPKTMFSNGVVCDIEPNGYGH